MFVHIPDLRWKNMRSPYCVSATFVVAYSFFRSRIISQPTHAVPSLPLSNTRHRLPWSRRCPSPDEAPSLRRSLLVPREECTSDLPSIRATFLIGYATEDSRAWAWTWYCFSWGTRWKRVLDRACARMAAESTERSLGLDASLGLSLLCLLACLHCRLLGLSDCEGPWLMGLSTKSQR